MAELSFEEILKRPTSEIKPPPPFPAGHYHCMVDGPPEHMKSKLKQTDFFRFKYKILGAQEDVDQRAVAEQQLIGKHITEDRYLTSNMVTQNMMKEFLTDVLGIENPDNKKNLEQMIGEAPNCQLIVEVKLDFSQDGKRTYHKVNSTAHV
jgi:hypothetical protein